LSYIGTISGSELKNKIKPKLSSLEIELTERCNNSCVHCYIKKENTKEECKTDKLLKIIDEAASLGCMKIKLTGGEPLLRRDFSEIYTHIRKLGIRVLLYTNGCMIDEEHIELFKKLPPVEPIEISVYGISEKTYEAVTRVKGSFSKMVSGVKKLNDNEIPFVLKFVTLDLNREDTKNFESWALAEFPFAKVQPPFEVMLNLSTDNNSEVNERIKKHRTPPEVIVESYFKAEEFEKSTKNFIMNFSALSGDKLFRCSKYGKSIVIDAYGMAYGCNLLKGERFAFDLNNGSLSEALSFFDGLRKTLSKREEYIKRCGNCFLRSYCEMCPALSYIETGELDSPLEYYCSISHLVGERLGLLKKGEKAWETRLGG